MKQVFFLIGCVCLLSSCGHVGDLSLPKPVYAKGGDVPSEYGKKNKGTRKVELNKGESR